jgi:hypothetical protein
MSINYDIVKQTNKGYKLYLVQINSYIEEDYLMSLLEKGESSSRNIISTKSLTSCSNLSWVANVINPGVYYYVTFIPRSLNCDFDFDNNKPTVLKYNGSEQSFRCTISFKNYANPGKLEYILTVNNVKVAYGLSSIFFTVRLEVNDTIMLAVTNENKGTFAGLIDFSLVKL